MDLSVDPQALRDAAGDLRAESKRIGAALAGLEQEVSRLSGAWNGQARADYGVAQQKWGRMFTDMNALLAQISAETERIADGYVERDNHSAGRFTVI